MYVFRISIDYFTNISRFLLQADQKEYKINLIMTCVRVLDIFLQYFLLIKGYWLYIIFFKDIFIIFLINQITEKKVKHGYKWLNLNSDKLDYSFIRI